jgi:hypothetical protein
MDESASLVRFWGAYRRSIRAIETSGLAILPPETKLEIIGAPCSQKIISKDK